MLCRWKPSTLIIVIVALLAATGVSSNQADTRAPVTTIGEAAR